MFALIDFSKDIAFDPEQRFFVDDTLLVDHISSGRVCNLEAERTNFESDVQGSSLRIFIKQGPFDSAGILCSYGELHFAISMKMLHLVICKGCLISDVLLYLCKAGTTSL